MKLQWIEKEVPENVKVRQVYAVVFNEQGKVLLKHGDKKGGKTFSLAGGTPELFDINRVATLKREFIEELNTSLKDPVYYLGYQLVDEENGIEPYAQIRMTAMIETIGEKKPDPDCGVTYDRVLVEPEQAIKLLNWGDIGERIIHKAVSVAAEKFNIDFSVIDNLVENV